MKRQKKKKETQTNFFIIFNDVLILTYWNIHMLPKQSYIISKFSIIIAYSKIKSYAYNLYIKRLDACCASYSGIETL